MKKVTLDSSNEFESVLIELKEMHDRKSKDDEFPGRLGHAEFGELGGCGPYSSAL